ncbi:unnamed protein product [Mycena citricolor]|nr:unnamed protein product [Mycena citricolor]
MQGSPSTSLNRFGASSPNALQSQQSLHRRLASEPVATNSGTTYTHARAATDSPDSQGSGLRNSKLLRKPAPRAQVPVSAYEGEERLPVAEPVRAHLPSVISEGGDDLTGVGASGRTPDVFYATSPFGPHNAPPLPMRPTDLPHERFQSRSNPPSLGSGSHSPSPRSSPHPNATPPREESPHGVFLHDHPSGTDSLSYSGPLLGSSAFRDTTFSDATNSTYATAIPIKWTGDERESAAPNIPGGWQSTPITEEPFSEEEEEEEEDDEEDEEDEEDDDLDEHDLPTPDVQQVPRVNSPDVQSPDVTLRKSEAGLVGLIAASETPPVPADGGKGWVLVDIDGQPGPGDSSPVAPSPATPAPSDHSRKATPAAKAIAVMDAVEAKGKSPTASKSEGSSQVVSDADTRNAIDLVKSATTDSKQSKPKTRLRDRLRLRG